MKQICAYYDFLSLESYVIMPNHIHILLRISTEYENSDSIPANTVIARFVSTFKRFCNREYGRNIWQSRSYDHIIRDKSDYEAKIRYIYENPKNWYMDTLYSDE
ncbi:MAG: transposase [Clostridia bacterium]|nr:transposase [Clostridia bacterium]